MANGPFSSWDPSAVDSLPPLRRIPSKPLRVSRDAGMKMRGANVPSKSTAGIGYLEGTDGMGLMTGLAVASLASSAIGSWLQNRAQNKATRAGIRANQQAQATTRQGELFDRQMARAEMNRNMPRARIANAALQWGMKDTGAKEAGFFDYHPSTWDPNYVMTADQGRLQRQIDEDIAMENQRKHRGFGMATYASPSQDYGMAPYSSPRESLTMSDMVMRTPQGTFQEEQIRERPIWAPPPIDFYPDAPWGKPRPDGGGPMPPPGGGMNTGPPRPLSDFRSNELERDRERQRLEAMRRGRPEPRGKTGPSSRSGSFGRGPVIDEEYISMSSLVP